MGIRGLETFMEKHTNACPKVDVIKHIHQYRKDHNCTPVIVVDGMSVMRYLYKFRNLSWIYGGQLKEYEETLKEFILKFLNEGAELVFFFDGPCVTSKRETWVKKRKVYLQRIYSILDGLEEGQQVSSHEDNRGCFIIPANVKGVTVHLAKKYHCQVRNSVRECDLEIAEYASVNKCMGILAQDSHFVIFYASKYYFSMKNFIFEKMSTVNYDSYRLAMSLRINTKQLPLLASLLGNDVISTDDLKNFHMTMVKRRGQNFGRWIDFHTLFTEVAKFIKSMPSEPLNTQLIATVVFGDQSKSTLIEDSLNSYNVNASKNANPGPPTFPDDNWNSVLKKLHDLQVNSDTPSAFYSIMVYQEYSCSTCMEDYRKSDLPASQTVLKPIRERLYGILLYEKPCTTGALEVQEIVVCSETSLDEPVFVKAVKPSVHHPGLLSLWSGSQKEASWILIGDVFGIDYRLIQTLPPHLVIPAVTLRYICKHVTIEQWELKALVSSAVLVKLYNGSYLSRVQVYGTVCNTRSIRLYTLISRAYSTTQMIFHSTGNPLPSDEFQATNYQDGILFHNKYFVAKEQDITDMQLCDGKEVSLNYFNQLMDFILPGERPLTA